MLCWFLVGKRDDNVKSKTYIWSLCINIYSFCPNNSWRLEASDLHKRRPSSLPFHIQVTYYSFLSLLFLIKYMPFFICLLFTLTFYIMYSAGFIWFFFSFFVCLVAGNWFIRLKPTKKDRIFSFLLFYQPVKLNFDAGFSLFFAQVLSFKFVLGWFVWAFAFLLLLNWLVGVFFFVTYYVWLLRKL